MRDDIRSLLKQAAPSPVLPVDDAALARRARKARLTRFLAGATSVVLIAAAGAGATTLARSSEGDVAGDERGAPEVPDGPRYVVATGTYGSDWQEPHRGQDWELRVWGEGDVHCWQLFGEEDTPSNAGTSCSVPGREMEIEDVFFGGSRSFFTGSPDLREGWFIVGEVGPRIDQVTFEVKQGPIDPGPIELELLSSPPEADLGFRYFVATLPTYDYARMTALSDGEVLETQNLCGPGCQADREQANDDEVAAYEAQPITEISHAATFASAALGHAGLINDFGTRYVYKGIAAVGDGYVATFDVARCAPPEDGAHRCPEDIGEASVRVTLNDGLWEVADARGSMTTDQRRALLDYAESVSDEGPRWRHIATSVAREGANGDWWYSVAMVWTGNLPGPKSQYGSQCRFFVFDAEGDEIEESRDIPFEVRDEEEFRVSAPMGGLDRETEGPERIVVECDPPSGDMYEEVYLDD